MGSLWRLARASPLERWRSTRLDGAPSRSRRARSLSIRQPPPVCEATIRRPSTPYPCRCTAKRLSEGLGIAVERNSEFAARDAFQKLNLGAAMFFDKEHFGEDRLVAGNGRLPWPEFFAKAPLSDAARRDLTRIYGKNPDYMAGMTADEKTARLAGISYQDYLLNIA